MEPTAGLLRLTDELAIVLNVLTDADASSINGACNYLHTSTLQALALRKRRYDLAWLLLRADRATLRERAASNHRRLGFAYSRLDDDAAIVLAEHVLADRSCPIRTLVLCRGHISAVGATALAGAVCVGGSLTDLYLCNHPIGNGGAQSIATAIALLRFLKKLVLLRDNIGSDGARFIAEALCVSRSMKELNLDDNHLRSDGAKHIAKAIQRKSTLRGLSLNACGIDKQGAEALASAWDSSASLSEIEMQSNPLGEAGVEALSAVLDRNVRAMPQLRRTMRLVL